MELESTRVRISLPNDVKKFQIGMVVNDARKTADTLTKKFGVGPFVEEVYPGVEAEIHGKPGDYKLLAFSTNLGPVELEIVQVLEGEPIHKEFLRERGEGMHHIGLYVENFDKELSKWERAGHKVLQKSRLPPPYPKTGGYAYIDTEDLIGVILELANPPPPSL